MKTAIQELIDSITHHVETQSSEWKKDPIAMLHQINALYFRNAIKNEKINHVMTWGKAVETVQGTSLPEFNDFDDYYTETYKNNSQS